MNSVRPKKFQCHKGWSTIPSVLVAPEGAGKTRDNENGT